MNTLRGFAAAFVLVIAVAIETPWASASANGDSEQRELQDRMKSRIPTIAHEKAAGRVGEGADGFLVHFGAPTGESASLVAEENRDRAKAYALIAARNGASVEFVGRARARQLAKDAAPGTMVQSAEDGTWRAIR